MVIDVSSIVCVSPKCGLIGTAVTGRASSVKAWYYCLSAHLQTTIPVVLSAALSASGLEDRVVMGGVRLRYRYGIVGFNVPLYTL